MGCCYTKMTEEELTELAATTKFTKTEIEEWHAAFTASCPTGKITKSAFASVYDQFFTQGNAADFSGFLFNLFDRENEGVIKFAQFVTALSVTARGNKIEDKLEWAFDLYDIDKSGSIDRDEMGEIFSSIRKMRGGQVDQIEIDCKVDAIFAKIDADGNGEISKSEFLEGVKEEKSIIEAFSVYENLR